MNEHAQQQLAGSVIGDRSLSTSHTRLVLGGHSFIEQLGADPCPDPRQQVRLVEACLDAGITWFDTTYQPERVALGRALAALGRRNEATIIAWNFFRSFTAGQDVGGAEAYQPDRMPQMLDELQTDRIDCLVVHPVSDAAANAAQEALAMEWKARGLVGKLGLWHSPAAALARHSGRGPYEFIVHPLNIITRPIASQIMVDAKALSLMTLACSPFVRGWELDKLTQAAVTRLGLTRDQARQRLADHMLRFSLFAPAVDRLIVSMRQCEWVSANVQAACRGPLTEIEMRWLEELAHATGQAAKG